MNKIEATKYILLQLCNWYYELNPEKKESGDNDLSILKSLKLIFLLSTTKDSNKESLLDKNFKFEAWPLGPVEKDIYKNRCQLYFNDDFKSINYKTLTDSKIDLINNEKMFLNNIINQLKIINQNLINYSASDLVEITHKYPSWINTIKLNNIDKSINRLDIENKENFYSL